MSSSNSMSTRNSVPSRLFNLDRFTFSSISDAICPLLLLPCLLLVLPLAAQADKNPAENRAKYMGVASCSSSNCHGATAPRDATNVLQNEYTTWSKHDAHSRAWLVLAEEDSKIIGAHLGIERPEEDPWCLSCHATYHPDENLRGEKFRIEDGVGCESCHGAAENYLRSHTERGATHADNIKNGMTSLVSADSRGRFCLTCHLGTDDKTVNHRLIGAGHPRLTFELDTFSALEPAHWDVDDDYRSRKEDYIPAKAWLIGQVVRAEELLGALQSTKRSRAGEGILAGPELTTLYCYTCHHSLAENQWKERSYEGRPGELRLNVSSFVILESAFEALQPTVSASLGAALKQLHDSSDPKSVGTELTATLSKAREFAEAASYDEAMVKRLLRTLTIKGRDSGSPPFEVAEQIAMGISSLVGTLSPDGSLHKREVDQIYSALAEPATFQPGLFTVACEQLLKRL